MSSIFRLPVAYNILFFLIIEFFSHSCNWYDPCSGAYHH